MAFVLSNLGMFFLLLAHEWPGPVIVSLLPLKQQNKNCTRKYEGTHVKLFLSVSDVFYLLMWGGCHFWPQGHNLNKLGKGLHIKYQGSLSGVFRQEDVFMFSLNKPTGM